MLELIDVSAGYGGTTVLEDVSLTVGGTEAVTILGPNGAGKSTLMACVMGLVPITSGEIRFDGERIDGLSTREIVRRGLVLCPEKRHLFPAMSLRDNLLLGAYARGKEHVDADLESVYAMFPVLEERGALTAGMLSGGEQQMLAIGRALMARPRMLLLDEPSLGLAPIITRNVIDQVARINAAGTGLCLVEQNAALALEVADRGYVLESGVFVVEGTAEELTDDPRVKAAYLGATL